MIANTFMPDLPVEFTEKLSAKIGNLEDLSERDVATAIAACKFIHGLFTEAADSIANALCQGVDAKDFAAKYEQSISSLDAVSEIVGRVLERARANSLPALRKEFIARYEDLASDLLKIKQFLQEAIKKSKTPSRPLDWERIRKAEAAYTSGEMKPFRKQTGDRSGG